MNELICVPEAGPETKKLLSRCCLDNKTDEWNFSRHSCVPHRV